MVFEPRKAGLFLVALASLVEAGCSHVPKEKSAPCRRPANLTSYAPATAGDCGPMEPVNGDPDGIRAAITALGK